jgi:hypothetical protein
LKALKLYYSLLNDLDSPEPLFSVGSSTHPMKIC